MVVQQVCCTGSKYRRQKTLTCNRNNSNTVQEYFQKPCNLKKLIKLQEIFNPNKVTENFSYTIYWETELAQSRDPCTENQNLESWISMNRLMKLLSSTELLILQGLTLIYIYFENNFNKEKYANIQLAIMRIVKLNKFSRKIKKG